jgi:hypothetical protein
MNQVHQVLHGSAEGGIGKVAQHAPLIGRQLRHHLVGVDRHEAAVVLEALAGTGLIDPRHEGDLVEEELGAWGNCKHAVAPGSRSWKDAEPAPHRYAQLRVSTQKQYLVDVAGSGLNGVALMISTPSRRAPIQRGRLRRRS